LILAFELFQKLQRLFYVGLVPTNDREIRILDPDGACSGEIVQQRTQSTSKAQAGAAADCLV
jgi:hypothetical protein